MPQGQQVRQARNILDPLTEVGLSELRAKVRTAFVAGTPHFRCLSCNEPLFVAQNPASPDTPRDGRGSHFKHHSNPDAPPCPQRSAANLHDIGAVKFQGLSEGAAHSELKHMLAFCLSQDPRVTDIQIERQIRALEGSWRQPDVSFELNGQMVAVDVQLAAASLATILERGAFYAANKIRHIWVTDASSIERLSQLAFRDIYLSAGGRIFALDADVVAACVEHSALHLKELCLAPRVAPPMALHNVWDCTMVDHTIIVMDPATRKAEGEKRYRKALAAQVNQHFGPQRSYIRVAITQGKSLEWMRPEWTRIANQIKGRSVDTAMADGLARCSRGCTPRKRTSPAPTKRRELVRWLSSKRQAPHSCSTARPRTGRRWWKRCAKCCRQFVQRSRCKSRASLTCCLTPLSLLLLSSAFTPG